MNEQDLIEVHAFSLYDTCVYFLMGRFLIDMLSLFMNWVLIANHAPFSIYSRSGGSTLCSLPFIYLLNKHLALLRRQSNEICLNQHNDVLTNLVERSTTIKSGTESFLKIYQSISDINKRCWHPYFSQTMRITVFFQVFIRFVQLCQVRNLLGISIFHY
jgi:hypothetical protein